LRLREILGSVLLGAMLVYTGCQEKSVESQSVGGGQKPSQVLKDFEMNDIKNSEKTMTLQSIEGRMYESQNVAEVDQPHIIFYKQGKESSRLRAPAGRVQMNTHEVEAWGGVTVVSADSSTLTVEHLRYDPKTQKITSTDTVHLEKPDSITDGVGLVTDPSLKTIKIGRQKVRFKQGMNP
jgi:LPS export ABC transporter protein LptC